MKKTIQEQINELQILIRNIKAVRALHPNEKSLDILIEQDEYQLQKLKEKLEKE